MGRLLALICVASVTIGSCSMVKQTPVSNAIPPIMTWVDLTDEKLPEPTLVHTYGEQAHQVIDVWIPEGSAPHPVVLMIHGGCWQKAIADRTLMNYAAETMRQRGIAVWNIEYRGVDEVGGGYPGTFLDVSIAADELMRVGATYELDLERIVGFGHSAGGHLATWLAAQPNLPTHSPVRTGNSVPMLAVVNSGGLADLEASAPVTKQTCLQSILKELTGSEVSTRQNVFSDTSPTEMLPFETHIVSVNGKWDDIAPPILGRSITDKIESAGGKASYVEVETAGHVELIAPGTEALESQIGVIESYFKQ